MKKEAVTDTNETIRSAHDMNVRISELKTKQNIPHDALCHEPSIKSIKIHRLRDQQIT